MTNQELATTFDELFDQIPPAESHEEIAETLRSEGYDPDAIGQQMAEVVRKLITCRFIGCQRPIQTAESDLCKEHKEAQQRVRKLFLQKLEAENPTHPWITKSRNSS